jgi:pteridine reductase
MTPTTLRDQVVLITGGAKRVGAAITRALHGAGANVMIHYRQSSREASQLASELEAARPNSTALVSGDLLDTAGLPKLVSATLARFQRLDILVNNASSFYPTPIGAITEAHWADLMGTNLKAPLFLSQAAAPHLKNTRGQIINIVDIHALRPLRNHVVYGAAKAGLLMLTRSLAKELAPEIRVNGIAPGPVMWPEGQEGGELRAKILERTLLKRAGSPEDIARTALFFAKDAPYITGQILPVDGGRSVAW